MSYYTANMGTYNFRQWLKNGPLLSSFIYHTGYLPLDKRRNIGTLVLEDQVVIDNARLAMGMYEEGHVELTQRRLAAGVYEYVATKRRKRRGK